MQNTNDWNADGDSWNADGDNEYTFADGEDGLDFSASGKKGFWHRQNSRDQNAQTTAIHTEQKVKSVGMGDSVKAAAYSKKLVTQGVNPEVAHNAAIGKAYMIESKKKVSLGKKKPQASVKEAIEILQRLV